MKGTVSESLRKKQVKQQKRREFRKFLHDKQRGTFCNRTPIQWLLIIVYYIVFICLICIIFLLIIYSIRRGYFHGGARPPIKKEYLVEKAAPGVTILPSRVDSHSPSIIWYTHTGKDGVKNRRYTKYVKELSRVLQDEEKLCKQNAICKLYCNFNATKFGPCSGPDFGYHEDKPCLFLKLNRFPAWRPGYYGHKSEIQKHVPENIKQMIKLSEETVWIECNGNRLYDRENIGKISYYPNNFFDNKFFPFPETNCAVPMLAMQLTELKRGALVNIECSAYAKRMDNQIQDDTYLYVDVK